MRRQRRKEDKKRKIEWQVSCRLHALVLIRHIPKKRETRGNDMSERHCTRKRKRETITFNIVGE